MANKKSDQKSATNGHDSGGIKVRVIEFELHGRNATVSEGIKAITEAISSRTVVVPEPRRPALPQVSKSGTATAVIESDDLAELESGEQEPSPIEAEEEAAPTGNGTKRSYSFKTPTFLNDLDVTKAKKDLKQFVGEKNPQDVMSKYLVVVYFLQKYMDVPEVTVNHVYTVFDTLGWKAEMPLKPGKPLADLKSKRHMLTREPEAEGYKLNFKGDQEVEKMGATK
jgi:hypothetical protein